jgi:hypothetical protein
MKMKNVKTSTGGKRRNTRNRYANPGYLQNGIIPRSTGQPVTIGYLLESVKDIAGHPDRNRLLGELFNT